MAQTQTTTGKRYSIDCRSFPSSGCSLEISGTETEVLNEAERHAIFDHGHKAQPGLRDELKKLLKEEKSYSA